MSSLLHQSTERVVGVKHDLEKEPLSGEEVLYSAAKLAGKPWLMIAMPVGNKRVDTKLNCPKEIGGCGFEFVQTGNVYPHFVPLRWHVAFTNMTRPLNVATYFAWDAGRQSALARSRLTQKAIEIGAEFILYMDDDTIPPQKGLYTMMNFLSKNKHIGAVTGVVTTRVPPTEPTIYKEHGKGTYWDLEIGEFAEPEPIFGAGAAFLLARVSAIKDVMQKYETEHGQPLEMWADEEIFLGPTRSVALGHDVRFCYLLNKFGWPVYADGRVVCGHLDAQEDQVYGLPPDYPGIKKYQERIDAQQKQETEEVHDSGVQEQEVREEGGDTPKNCVRVPQSGQGESSAPKVEIIVVGYKQPEYMARTIERVEACTEYPNYNLWQFENQPGVSLAKCWNELIGQCGGEYICLLNPDTAVTPGWLTKLVDTMKAVPMAGAVVPSSNAVHLSQIDIPFGRFEFDFDKINEFAAGLTPHTLIDLPTLSAMCVLFPRKLWDEIGGFDEEFDLYGEDTEFFYRLAQKTGRKLLWRKDAYVHHYKAMSVQKAIEDNDIDYMAARQKAAELCAKKIPNYEEVVNWQPTG